MLRKMLKDLCLVTFTLMLLVANTSVASANWRQVTSSISNQHINAFVQDNRGYVWIGTAKGLCRYNGYNYFHYFHSSDSSNSLPADFITALYIDSYQKLWIATNKGVCRYNYETDDFSSVIYEKRATDNSFESGLIESCDRLYVYGDNGLKTIDKQALTMDILSDSKQMIIQTAVTDNYDQLWFSDRSTKGVYCMDQNSFLRVDIPDKSNRDILCSFLSAEGEIWFGTTHGIIVIEPSQRRVVSIASRFYNPELLSELSITFFHVLNDNELIIGTDNRGLFIYDRTSRKIKPASQTGHFRNNRSVHTTCCYADNEKNLWLGTFDQGYLFEAGAESRFNNDETLSEYFNGKFVTRIKEDTNLNLWVGTRYHGLVYYETSSGNATVYDDSNFEPLIKDNTNFIQSLHLDSRGNLWVGYSKSLMWCELNKGKIVSFRIYDSPADIVTLTEDDYGRIWAGSSSDGITIYDIKHIQSPIHLPLNHKWINATNIIKLRSGEMLFSYFDYGVFLCDPHTLQISEQALPEGASAFGKRIIYLYEDASSILWIGTYGLGLLIYDRINGNSQICTPKNGLPSNDVLAIVDDSDGNMWISTSYGISKYDKSTKRFMNYFDIDGTGGNQFHEKSVELSRNGRIFFGGNHGITSFNPKDIRLEAKSVPVILEDFKLFNTSVTAGTGESVLTQHISQTQSLVLSHRQNVFSIDYVGLDFNSSQKINYAYRLRGFDREWNYVGNYRRASYSNLKSGYYTFEVMAQNADGIWNEMSTSLDIRIKPAPWFNPISITVYIILLLLVVYFCITVYVRMQLDKERIALIEKERKHEHEMNELKIQFYNNISHELRTPLSMICGPVKKLIEGNNDHGTEKYLLNLLYYNTDNMIRLIDRLLDMGKLESDTLSLSVSHSGILPIVRDLITSYSFFANEKRIMVTLNCPDPDLTTWVDIDKFRMIVSNLLSNALKYTPVEGNVRIEVDIIQAPDKKFKIKNETGRYLQVSVVDDGIGMDPKNIPMLFQRYKRFGKTNVQGKGIGLHYAHQLVSKHHGAIVAELRERNGMVFSFIIPADRERYDQDKICDSAAEYLIKNNNMPKVSQGMSETHQNSEEEDSRPTLLIVEDNSDLRKFIASLFAGDYHIFEVGNGDDALRVIHDENINLVISDVIMPKMNGFELCDTLKKDSELCHIPVVLLTAKTKDTDQIEGYQLGADAYVTKPFNPTLLCTIVETIFKNRKQVQQRIIHSVEVQEQVSASIADTEISQPIELNPLDRKFLEKLYNYLDRELSNTELNVNGLGKDLAFSRTSFYRKIKALTGYPPTDFVRIYRLNRAAKLILEKEYSISEIIDIVGFSSNSHFSSCFRKHFGVNPRDYGKKI